MGSGKHEADKPAKGKKVVKAIAGLAGSIAVGAVVFWAMPEVQKKVADKMYKKMM